MSTGTWETQQRQLISCCCFRIEVSLHVPEGGKREAMVRHAGQRPGPRSATCHGAGDGTVAKATSDTFNHDNYLAHPTP
jgi:hypothetical protein